MVKADKVTGHGGQVSTEVRSNNPVLAGRAMYWPKGGPWSGGHATVGVGEE